MLAAAGILAYRRVERPEIEHLCRATGARPVFDIDGIQDEDVGRFASIREEKWNGVEHTIFEGSQSQGVTVILRGSTDMRLEEAERAFNDALGVACQLIREPQLLPGGGATHIALARRLRRHAETIPGREQMAIEAFSGALEVIPRTLAENAGLDPVNTIIDLRKAHSEGNSHFGVNVYEGGVVDMSESRVYEPSRVVEQAIQSASETATMILRIDDVISSRASPAMPEGGEFDGMGM